MNFFLTGPKGIPMLPFFTWQPQSSLWITYFVVGEYTIAGSAGSKSSCFWSTLFCVQDDWIKYPFLWHKTAAPAPFLEEKKKKKALSIQPRIGKILSIQPGIGKILSPWHFILQFATGGSCAPLVFWQMSSHIRRASSTRDEGRETFYGKSSHRSRTVTSYGQHHLFFF